MYMTNLTQFVQKWLTILVSAFWSADTQKRLRCSLLVLNLRFIFIPLHSLIIIG